jgi:hypothetical protein
MYSLAKSATKNQLIATAGVALLVASMILWLLQKEWKTSECLVLLPAYISASLALMALSGSRHANWHLAIIRIITLLVLMISFVLGLVLIAKAEAIGIALVIPGTFWWRYLMRIGWRGSDAKATAKLVAIGAVSTLVITLLIGVFQFFMWQHRLCFVHLQSHQYHQEWAAGSLPRFVSTTVAIVGCVLAAAGSHRMQRDLRAAEKLANVPVAQANVR